jgi:hypothetical protein
MVTEEAVTFKHFVRWTALMSSFGSRRNRGKCQRHARWNWRPFISFCLKTSSATQGCIASGSRPNNATCIERNAEGSSSGLNLAIAAAGGKKPRKNSSKIFHIVVEIWLRTCRKRVLLTPLKCSNWNWGFRRRKIRIIIEGIWWFPWLNHLLVYRSLLETRRVEA